MFSVTTIEPSSYYDSVVLMRVASQLKKRRGVSEAALFMGTQGNHELLHQVGLATPASSEAGPDDLIIIVKAQSDELAREMSCEALAILKSSRETGQDGDSAYRPRTLDRALDYLSGASLAAISIPGEYAAREALRCLDRDLNVFLFSDNVTLEDELTLKTIALDKGLLCMGPDCGTAYLNGVGLGFINRVKRGNVGCVAASGTGLQAVMCRLYQLGEGISHAIGVGGRDLSREVGGIMTLHALNLLEQDPSTEIIILLSKPPHPDLLERLNDTIDTLKTPVITCFQGADRVLGGADQAWTLDCAAERAVSQLRGRPYQARLFDHPEQVKAHIDGMVNSTNGGRIVGLYTGGTLAKEAQHLVKSLSGTVSATFSARDGHIIVDLGEDQYTVGRPHPMIAPENRTDVLVDLAASGTLDDCGVLLFDLVLGDGSHLDPAAELVLGLRLIKETYAVSIPVAVAVIGTEKDPQSLQNQVKILEESGVAVFLKNSEAARFAAMLADPGCCASMLEVIS